MGRLFTQENTGEVDGWAVWKIIGSMDADTSDAAYEMGLSMIQEHGKTVIDMSEMEYISSAGIRVLLKLCKQAEKMGNKLVAVGATGMVQSVLEDSRMAVLLNLKYTMDSLDSISE